VPKIHLRSYVRKLGSS